MGSSSPGKPRPNRKPNGKGSKVQPPDAENRTAGGVEGSRGAIPVTPSYLLRILLMILRMLFVLVMARAGALA